MIAASDVAAAGSRSGPDPARWPSSTWRCRATWTTPSTSCPARCWSTWSRSAQAHAATPGAGDVDAVTGIVADEVAAFGAAQRAARIAPTVVALRAMASEVVGAELARLDRPTGPPALDERSRAEMAQTVRRVVDKLLHAPTVRVKQLAAEPWGGASYADALRELFDLDPGAVHAVSGNAGRSADPALQR